MTHQLEARIDETAEITFSGAYVGAEPDRGPEYGSIAGPGNDAYADDVEATGLWFEIRKRDRYGRVERRENGNPVWERVDILAGVSAEARREVLIALTDAFRDEAGDALMEGA